MLYSGGFFSASDKKVMDAVRDASPAKLAEDSFVFEDSRLPEMLFRYRARNYPDSLSQEEQAQWAEYRFQRITEPRADTSYCMEEFQVDIETLLHDQSLPPAKRSVLEQLLEYADTLLA